MAIVMLHTVATQIFTVTARIKLYQPDPEAPSPLPWVLKQDPSNRGLVCMCIHGYKSIYTEKSVHKENKNMHAYWYDIKLEIELWTSRP